MEDNHKSKVSSTTKYNININNGMTDFGSGTSGDMGNVGQIMGVAGIIRYHGKRLPPRITTNTIEH